MHQSRAICRVWMEIGIHYFASGVMLLVSAYVGGGKLDPYGS